MQAHGGTIRASSAGPDRGSTFTIRLPAAFSGEPVQERGPERRAAQLRPGADGGPTSAHILLVEDDEDTATMMSAPLELHRYHVDVARSVADAVRKATDRQWDLLVSDIRLPDGTGLDLMRRLGERRARHAIAVSGFGSPDDVRRSLEAGFDQHLVKPVDMPTLLDVVGRNCRSSTPAAK